MSGDWLMPVRELKNFNCVRCLLYVAKNFICVSEIPICNKTSDSGLKLMKNYCM